MKASPSTLFLATTVNPGIIVLRLVRVLRSRAASGTRQRALTNHPAANVKQAQVYRSSKARPSDQLLTVEIGDVVKERASSGTMYEMQVRTVT